MNYIIKNITIPVSQNPDWKSKVQSLLGNQSYYIQTQKVLRRALDTRKKNQPVYVYTIQITTNKPPLIHPDILLQKEVTEPDSPEIKVSDIQPFIIGMGPAGLFCALAMVEKGLKPILFDRGDKLSDRAIIVDDFWKKSKLDTDSNVQFGEGGAGAFSDGKLTSRSRNQDIQSVFDLLIKFGAAESITWEALPHLGTDGIRAVVSKIRNYLLEQGCTYHYRSKLDDLNIENGRITEVIINDIKYAPEILIIAPGNAARDTFRMLAVRGVTLESKSFAIGFRISHPQAWINETIYGSNKWSDLLGAASYRLTAALAGKGTYTFCMCPGGYIISASSELETTVTNGMSYAARDFGWGNSAIVTNADSDTFGSKLLDGLKLQESIEQKAFRPSYAAPFQTAKDYLADLLSGQQDIKCLFPTAISAQISDIFPQQINQALKQGLKHFDKVLPGFIAKGLLIAPETRTSSPLRIVRDKVNFNCLNISNLYAIGEGSGYAGGIISSAADGFRIGRKFTL